MFMKIMKAFNWRNPFENNADQASQCMKWSRECDTYAEYANRKSNDKFVPDVLRDRYETLRNEEVELCVKFRDLAAKCMGFADFEHYERYLMKLGFQKIT